MVPLPSQGSLPTDIRPNKLSAAGPEERLAVRRGVARDRRRIIDLGERLFAPFGNYGGAIKNWLHSTGVRFLVIDSPENGVCGFSILTVLGEGQSPHVYLLGIGIDPAYRRQGYGLALLRESLLEAHKMGQRWGAKELRLTVAETNHPALQLFKRAGFSSFSGASASYSEGQRALVFTQALEPEK